MKSEKIFCIHGCLIYFLFLHTKYTELNYYSLLKMSFPSEVDIQFNQQMAELLRAQQPRLVIHTQNNNTIDPLSEKQQSESQFNFIEIFRKRSNKKRKTPSLMRISQRSIQRRSQKRLSNTSAFGTYNQAYPRRTCKMFELNQASDHVKTRKTLNNLLQNLEVSKFNVIQQVKNNQKQRLKSFRALSFISKQKANHVEAHINIAFQPSEKNQRKAQKKSKKMSPKERFSGELKRQKKKQRYSLIKQEKLTKFIQIENFIDQNKPNLIFKWDKNWKFEEKNRNLRHFTEKMSAKISKKNGEKKVYEERIQKKQHELKRLQSINKQIRKLKSNQKLIQSIKSEKEDKILEFFHNLEAQLQKCVNRKGKENF